MIIIRARVDDLARSPDDNAHSFCKSDANVRIVIHKWPERVLFFAVFFSCTSLRAITHAYASIDSFGKIEIVNDVKISTHLDLSGALPAGLVLRGH